LHKNETRPKGEKKMLKFLTINPLRQDAYVTSPRILIKRE
jgi:hypothetical protein